MIIDLFQKQFKHHLQFPQWVSNFCGPRCILECTHLKKIFYRGSESYLWYSNLTIARPFLITLLWRIDPKNKGGYICTHLYFSALCQKSFSRYGSCLWYGHLRRSRPFIITLLFWRIDPKNKEGCSCIHLYFSALCQKCSNSSESCILLNSLVPVESHKTEVKRKLPFTESFL